MESDREQRFAVAEGRGDGSDRGHILPKLGLGLGVDPAVEVRLADGEGLEHGHQHQHAAPGATQAISAPLTPVSWAKRRGSENTPAPTTIPAMVMRVSFCADGVSVLVVSVLAIVVPLSGAARRARPERAGPPGAAARDRHDERQMAMLDSERSRPSQG
jgi:hypothetical protein